MNENPPVNQPPSDQPPPQPPPQQPPYQPSPAYQALPPGGPSDGLVRQLSVLAAGSSGWMKLLGVLTIIQGIFLIFTIWGILICWLPIWVGVILFKAAGDAEMASRGAPTKLLEFQQKINRYFLIQGILALIAIIVGLVMVFVMGMAGFMHLGSYM